MSLLEIKSLRKSFVTPDGSNQSVVNVSELFDKIGWFERVLALVSYLVTLVAAGSILASIYNSMNERRREIVILRALGARRTTVFSAIYQMDCQKVEAPSSQ